MLLSVAFKIRYVTVFHLFHAFQFYKYHIPIEAFFKNNVFNINRKWTALLCRNPLLQGIDRCYNLLYNNPKYNYSERSRRMMKAFINREIELNSLYSEYHKEGSSLVIIYGRRRIGKTTLIKEFLKDKYALYYLATEEPDAENLRQFRGFAGDYIDNPLLAQTNLSWEDTFKLVINHKPETKKIIVLDEFQYLSKTKKAFPSVFQRIWDTTLQDENIMVILCGSLINMMESQTLSHGSPLYGRRTGQIKMQQIPYHHYHLFYEDKSFPELVEYYAVTGGVPKYIELFRDSTNIYTAIKENIMKTDSYLYEEPKFLLDQEVGEVGTYFSIIKTIAAGEHKIGKIAGVLGVKQSNLTRYLHTLMDLDLIRRIVPITEKNPEKSKRGLYYLTDNFIEFWFKFIYPNRSYIEMGNRDYVVKKIEENFIDQHVSFVFEDICREHTWRLAGENFFDFELSKLGKWWDQKNEIDLVGFNTDTRDILFGECKYWKDDKKVDIDVLHALMDKAALVEWGKNRQEHYILFSKSGFTDRLIETAKKRENVYLV